MDDQQLSLTTEWIDLSEEEKVERGLSLANLIREAQLLEDDHAERKKDMKKEREAVAEQIAALATIVRTGKEERPRARRIQLPPAEHVTLQDGDSEEQGA
jgi:hypothetical protein